MISGSICFVRYQLFSLVFSDIWHRCWFHCGSLLAYIVILRILFSNLFAAVPQRVLWEAHFSLWHACGSVLIPRWHPFCIWLPLASFLLPFAARRGIVMHFRIMYLDFRFATFMLIARWRDRGFAACAIHEYVYTNIYIYIFIYLLIYLNNIGQHRLPMFSVIP